MLEGPAGSLVEMELTSGVGAPSVVVLTRTEMNASHDSSGSGGELLGGEVGRVSVPATHSAAGAPGPAGNGDGALMAELEERYRDVLRQVYIYLYLSIYLSIYLCKSNTYMYTYIACPCMVYAIHSAS